MISTLRIFIVDDKKEDVIPVQEELKSQLDIEASIFEDFAEAKSEIAHLRPHLVILDVFRGASFAGGEKAGEAVYEELWSHHFCPVIIYSAMPEALESSDGIPHPLVVKEKKGSGSELRVVESVRGLLVPITALESLRVEVDGKISRTLKLLARRILGEAGALDDRGDFLVRASRRRIAAEMDIGLETEKLASWEHYVFPPIGDSPMLGDVLRDRNGDPNDPKTYSIILTPSCDLVRSGSRAPKVDNVLLARCADLSKLKEDIDLSLKDKKNPRGKLLPYLRQGHTPTCLALPALPNTFPSMAAQLKVLELVDVSDIGNGNDYQYERIASMDSPFRETVAWAYVQVTGRPGLPDRECETWADEIISRLREQASQSKGETDEGN